MKRLWDHPKAMRYVLYLLLFGTACLIAWNTPFCHDEWRWANPKQIKLMRRGFRNYNGRYLGNLLAIVISRYAVIRMLIMGGGFCLLVWGIVHCIFGQNAGSEYSGQTASRTRKEAFLLLFTVLSSALLLIMPQQLYEQSFGWSAAFVNFVPPVILFLMWFSMAENCFSRQNSCGPSVSRCVLSMLLCFCAQLFSEHNTIALSVFALSAVILCIIKKNKAVLFALCSFAGALAGAGLMFSNGAYHRAAVRSTGYKHIAVSVSVLVKQWHGVITEFLCYKPLLLHILLAAALIVLTILRTKQCGHDQEGFFGKPVPGIHIVLIAPMVFGICFFAFQSANSNWFIFQNTVWNSAVRDGIILVFYLCVLFLTILVSPPEKRPGNAGIWLMMALVSAPLTAASPIGARCFFVTYVLEMVLLLRLWADILCCFDGEQSVQILTLTGMALLLSLGLFYIRAFMVIGASVKDREARIETAVNAGADRIELPALPLSQFFWLSEPPNDNFEQDFRYFYQIPETMEISFF